MVAQAMAVYNKMSLPTVPEERELEEQSHRSEVNINLDWSFNFHIRDGGSQSVMIQSGQATSFTETKTLSFNLWIIVFFPEWLKP